MCGSGRPSSAGRAGGGARPAGVLGRPLGSRAQALQGEEGVGAGDERAVVVETGIASAFVVVEAEFSFELAVVELDRPAQLREPREALGVGVGGEVGEPVVRRCLGVWGPLDDQPLLSWRLVVGADRMGRNDTNEREAARDVVSRRCCAAGERLPDVGWQTLGKRPYRLGLAVGPSDRSRPAGASESLCMRVSFVVLVGLRSGRGSRRGIRTSRPWAVSSCSRGF